VGGALCAETAETVTMGSGGGSSPLTPSTSSGGCSLADDEAADPHFMAKLRTFLKQEYSVELDLTLGWKTPTVGGQKLDLSKLYREVTKRNGHKEVTVTKQWKQVADAFQLPKSLTSSSFLMRTHYERFLFEFEARQFGNQDGSNEPVLPFTSKIMHLTIPKVRAPPTPFYASARRQGLVVCFLWYRPGALPVPGFGKAKKA
jgi:hypothetical protein